MASIIWTDVTAHAPELVTAAVSVAAQADILAYVNDALDVTMFGGETAARTKMARIYLAAHLGTIDSQGSTGATGAVIGESIGGLSVQYASNSPAGTDPLYDKTPYGQAFRSIVRGSKARGPFVL
jgi:hypothetical protein